MKIIFYIILFTIFGVSCKSPNSDYSIKIKQLIDKWNKANNDKDVALLNEVYGDNLFYYGANHDKNYCIQDQALFFKKNPNSFQSILGEIQFEILNDNEIKTTFVKRVTIKNQTKDYPSYLTFNKINNGFKVSAEGQIGSVVNNSQNGQSLIQKGEIVREERQLLEPKYFSTTGDFDGDGQIEEIAEYLYSNKTKEKAEKADEEFGETKLLCSNTAIKDYILKGSGIGLQYLGNEGDLDGDGRDEISFIRDALQSVHRSLTVISYKNGSWNVIQNVRMNLDYSPAPQDVIIKTLKSKTIIINQWEFDAGVKKIEIKLN